MESVENGGIGACYGNRHRRDNYGSGVGKEAQGSFPGAEEAAVEPSFSAALSGGKAGRRTITGIGNGVYHHDVPDTDVHDSMVAATDGEAGDGAAGLVRKNGLIAGLPSGANHMAAVKAAEKPGYEKRVVALICDSEGRHPAACDKGRGQQTD